MHTKYCFYTDKIETNFFCTKVIRVRIDQVGIDSGGIVSIQKKSKNKHIFTDRVRNDRGLEMIVNQFFIDWICLIFINI